MFKTYILRVGSSTYSVPALSETGAKNRLADALGVTSTSYIKAVRRPLPSDRLGAKHIPCNTPGALPVQ